MERVHTTETNTVWAAFKGIMKHKKRFHVSIILQLGTTRFILKYPGVKTKGPVYRGLVEIKRILAVKIFRRSLSQNNEAAVVGVIILV